VLPGATGGRQLPLEAAASAAANRSQRRQQHQQGDAGECGQQSAPENPAVAAAAPAPKQQQEHPQQESRRKQRRERAVPRGDGIAAAGPRAAAVPGAQPAAGAAAEEADEEAPHCLVCCSAMAEVGVGACNHKEVCGQCTLRLRLCYSRHDCPLCKTELREVRLPPPSQPARHQPTLPMLHSLWLYLPCPDCTSCASTELPGQANLPCLLPPLPAHLPGPPFNAPPACLPPFPLPACAGRHRPLEAAAG
jgi:hypothetical protein